MASGTEAERATPDFVARVAHRFFGFLAWILAVLASSPAVAKPLTDDDLMCPATGREGLMTGARMRPPSPM